MHESPRASWLFVAAADTASLGAGSFHYSATSCTGLIAPLCSEGTVLVLQQCMSVCSSSKACQASTPTRSLHDCLRSHIRLENAHPPTQLVPVHTCCHQVLTELTEPLLCPGRQLARGGELAEVKRRVGLLKRVCRQRTQGAWKEWRTSMEQHRASWLASHLLLLQLDHTHLQTGLGQVHQVQALLHQLQTALREGMAARRMQQQVCCTRGEGKLGSAMKFS